MIVLVGAWLIGGSGKLAKGARYLRRSEPELTGSAMTAEGRAVAQSPGETGRWLLELDEVVGGQPGGAAQTAHP